MPFPTPSTVPSSGWAGGRNDRVAEPSLPCGQVISKGRKRVLSGTWRASPAPHDHDVPIGAWTCAFVLDLVGDEGTDRAAELLVGLGTLSALPTAAAGLSDWSDTWGEDRRVGMAHAVGNVAAVASYGLSYLARRGGHRRAGVALAMVGRRWRAVVSTGGTWREAGRHRKRGPGPTGVRLGGGPAEGGCRGCGRGRPIRGRAVLRKGPRSRIAMSAVTLVPVNAGKSTTGLSPCPATKHLPPARRNPRHGTVRRAPAYEVRVQDAKVSGRRGATDRRGHPSGAPAAAGRFWPRLSRQAGTDGDHSLAEAAGARNARAALAPQPPAAAPRVRRRRRKKDP